MNLARCGDCGNACRTPARTRSALRCPHCGARLPRLRPPGTASVWALLLGAAILYVPANLLPIFKLDILGQPSQDTILEGIVQLFASGMWGVGCLVFLASIVIPLLKIIGLGSLLVSVRARSRTSRPARTRLYRIIEAIGPWSMIDVFVVSLTISLVQFGGLASFEPGSGAACFALVVILTLLATRSFDPQILWKRIEEN